MQAARDVAMAILDANPELGAYGEGGAADAAWRLDEEGRGIIARELRRRFARDIDWSAIS